MNLSEILLNDHSYLSVDVVRLKYIKENGEKKSNDDLKILGEGKEREKKNCRVVEL